MSEVSSPLAFELDPEAARINASPLRVGAHAATATAVLAVAVTDSGQELLGVHPFYLVVFTFLFVVDHVEAAARIRDGSLFSKDRRLRRMLAFVVPVLYTACFAAPSSIPAVPTWAFLAMGGVARGLGGYRFDRTFVLTIAGCGIGLHLLTCPSLSVLSVGAAVCATAIACVAGYGGQRMIARALLLQLRARVAADLAAEARGQKRALAAAMSLHDGLSGMLFGVRAKLEGAVEASEVRTAARALVGRARELLAPMSESITLDAALRDLSSTYGVPMTVDVQTEGVSPLEESDLTFSAIELAANALRHGKPSRVSVRVAAGPVRKVVVSATEPAALASRDRPAVGLGRGTRHLELRAKSWGGSYTVEDHGPERSSTVRWPSPLARVWPSGLILATPASASAFGLVVWAGEPDPRTLLFVVACVVMSAAMVGLGAWSLRATARVVDETSVARGAQLRKDRGAIAASGLEEGLVAFRDAAEGDDLHATRGALAALGLALQRALAALEADGGLADGPSGNLPS